MGRHTDDLNQARQQIAALEQAIASTLGTVANALDSVESAQRDRLSQAVLAASAVAARGPDDELAAWQDAHWTNWQPAFHTPAEIRIGLIEAAQDLPATVPLFDGRAVVLATQTRAAAEHARQALRAAAVRCAATLGPNVRLHLIDPYQEGFGFPERTELGNAVPVGQDLSASLTNVIQTALPAASGQPMIRQIVIALDFPRSYGFQGVELINRIGRLGPAGVQLIVHHAVDADDPGRHDDLDLDNPIVVNVDANGRASGAWGVFSARLDTAAPASVIGRIGAALAPQNDQLPGDISWADINEANPERWCRGDSVGEVTACVGRASDGSVLEISLGQDQDGESRAHMVIGGQNGSGKSVLLRTFIMSLATRYSPDELRFYLIDGQQGTSLKLFADLPHTELVALNTPVDLMRAMLLDVDAEITRRSGLITDHGLEDIARYRDGGLAKLPRLVVVIDEYQYLFTSDIKDETARVLQRITAQGRKVGIHLVLASQRFHATGLVNQEALFANIRTRVALMMPPASIDGITEFQREGRALIHDHCVKIGQVVVNEHNGADGSNVAGRVAMLDTAAARTMITKLADRYANAEPVVINGEDQPEAIDSRTLQTLGTIDAADHARLQAWAKSSERDGGLRVEAWQPYDHPFAFIAGRSLSVHGSAAAVVLRKQAGNVLLVADDPEVMCGIMATGLASTALSVPPGRLQAVVLSQLPPPGSWAGVLGTDFPAIAAKRGHHVTAARTDAEAVGLLNQAITELEHRTGLDMDELAECGPFLVVACGLQRLASFRVVEGRYETEASEAGRLLVRALRDGPNLGVHVLLGFESRSQLDEVLPPKSSRHFEHRFVRQMNEPDSRALLDNAFGNRIKPPVQGAAVIGPDRAGYSNRTTNQETVFMPYIADDQLVPQLTALFDGSSR